MGQILIIVGVAVLVVVLIGFVAAMLWRPARDDDTDRFLNARRITTTWAADAGTDLAHPTPGQPGTVDTSPEATEAPEARGSPVTPEVSDTPPPTEPTEAIDLRRQTAPRTPRRPPRA
jgi:hypothetical protein